MGLVGYLYRDRGNLLDLRQRILSHCAREIRRPLFPQLGDKSSLDLAGDWSLYEDNDRCVFQKQPFMIVQRIVLPA